jgi:hypothetical protein
MPEHLWERQHGESAKAFAAFECYRMLGVSRSLQAAWEKHYTRPGTLLERTRRGREEAGLVVGYFRRWYKRWQWAERAAAWDEDVAAFARDQELDRELQARLADQEEDRRQRGLMKEEARAARAVGRRILLRILQGVEAGELERLKVPDLLPHLQKVATLLEAGQKLERLDRGEATDRTETALTEEIGLGERIAAALLEAVEAKQLDLQALAAVRDELAGMEG